MKISKSHKKFAVSLNDQEILNRPEKYLGPNWEEVINFWLYLDILSKEQLRIVENRYMTLSDEECITASGRSRNVARDTTNYAYDVSEAAFASVSNANWVAANATEELIGLDKLLEQGHQPVFFPMFLNP
jgi:hypothetical protein